MVKETKKSYKALKVAVVAVLGAGLLASGIGNIYQASHVSDMTADLASMNATLTSSQLDSNTKALTISSMNESLKAYGLEVEDLKANITTLEGSAVSQDAVIADLQTVIADLNASIEAVEPVVVFTGYDKEFGLGEDLAFTLTDNQFEKLGDYEVDVDGEDVAVEESLKVNATFMKEDKLSLMFDENSIEYVIEYEADKANLSEDSMKISLFGEEVEVIAVESGKLTLKTTDDKFVKAGESLNGVTVLKIGADAILVQVGDDKELLSAGTHKVNDIEIEVGDILYIEGDEDNVVNLKAGVELEKVYKTTGDDKYYDAAEMWEFKSIEEGKFVIGLAEEVEEVSELMLPNDYAKISFKVDDVDYNKVKIEKEDGVITKVMFELENYDSTYVELKNNVWETEDDEEVIDFTAGVELKDSDFKLYINANNKVLIKKADSTDVLVKIDVDSVQVDGDDSFDNDENFISVDGIVVEPTEDYTDDEDETLEIEVPEESVKATVIVE